MRKILTAIVIACACSTSHAEVALSASIGTLGYGIQATFPVSSQFNVRVIANTFSDSGNFEESGINYQGDLDFATYGVLGDWHPFTGSFFVSAGAVNNGNQVKLKATCPQSCDIDGHSYQSFPDGQVNANVDFKSLAPYLGIGWGNAMQGGRWYGQLDVGVLFQDAPNINLTASGTFKEQGKLIPVNTSNPVFQKELANEERSIEQEIDDTEFSNVYPVIALSVGYRF